MKMMIIAATSLTITFPAFAEADSAKGEMVFKRCSACHAVGEGAKNKVGPQLNGLFGRPAGGAPGYNYSAAMKKAGEGGVVWTADELRSFLSAPKEKVPGNKMALSGISKPADLDDLMSYLESATAQQ